MNGINEVATIKLKSTFHFSLIKKYKCVLMYVCDDKRDNRVMGIGAA